MLVNTLSGNSRVARAIIFLTIASTCLLMDGIVGASETTQPPYPRHTEDRLKARYNEYEYFFRQFIQVVEDSMELRRDALSFFRELHTKLVGDEHLTSANQQMIKDNLQRYRENRDSLEDIVNNFDRYSDPDVNLIFTVDSKSQELKEKPPPNKGDHVHFYINPNDDLGRLMILHIKTWLASKLIIFDNYVVVLVRYLKEPGSRRQIDLEAIDPAGKKFLEEISAEITNDEKYDRVFKIISLVQQVLNYQHNNPSSNLAKDKDNLYLDTIIEGSYSYRRIPELNYGERLGFKSDALKNIINDNIVNLTYEATNSLSELFGNAVGLYEERKGKLYQMDKVDQEKITSELKLLDILFEKTPFRLTDRFIPGHWGHVALWVGSKDDIPELKRLGVWQELPGIESYARQNYGYSGPPFQTLLEQDYGVLEALRHGVELNTFAHFLNIDDLAVVRADQLTDGQKKDYLLRAFAQIGKEYDFNFDIESNNSIVCSELIFVVLANYNWPVEHSFGRYTVSPDHIARLAITEVENFSPILIIHDGILLPKVHNSKNFQLLLEGNYRDIEYFDH